MVGVYAPLLGFAGPRTYFNVAVTLGGLVTRVLVVVEPRSACDIAAVAGGIHARLLATAGPLDACDVADKEGSLITGLNVVTPGHNPNNLCKFTHPIPHAADLIWTHRVGEL